MDDRCLTEKEIDEFLNELDPNNQGTIEYSVLESKLDETHREVAPESQLLTPNCKEAELDDEERHAFLRSMTATDKSQIPRDELKEIVKGWKIPSKERDQKAMEDNQNYLKSMTWSRKLRAFWSVDGPWVMFLVLVVSMQIAFGTWQMVTYLTSTKYTRAFGWGVVFAKTFAGALYPTMFFLIMSMSRYLSTIARKSYYLSRFINWDLSRTFHIIMAIATIVFGTCHSVGHLTGTFNYGSRPARQVYVGVAIGEEVVPMSYQDYLTTVPGWTGLVALGLFYIIGLLGMPVVRKKSYEAFQLGHLLIFPIIALLCAHGSSAFLQKPMLGYWLALPTLLVLIERCIRLVYGLVGHMPATIRVLDENTIVITVTISNKRWWPYKAGQFVFLQVPQVSMFQWHPFTISTCIGNEMTVHIKTDGNWTSQVRKLAAGGERQITVGIDGPFGAPAQRFYDFDQALVLGSGIGVTPFSGILADMQARDSRLGTSLYSTTSLDSFQSTSTRSTSNDKRRARFRRVDFHWIVKEQNALHWFSDLLNSVWTAASNHAKDSNPLLKVNIYTYVTQARKELSAYIFRYLLECHRTPEHPESPLTGLLNETQFGRPDLSKIMDKHYESMLEWCSSAKGKGIKVKRRRVGVFFCGMPSIGRELADRCQLLTVRAREDKSFIEYHFISEVF